MLSSLLRRGGLLLALALVSAAALASLFGTEQAQSIAASPVFIIAAALTGIASLVAGIAAVAGRRWTSVLLHFGFVLTLAGIAVNQRAARPGYLFLEHGSAGRNLYISRDLRRLEVLPVTVRLDSITMRTARGFRAAAVAFTTVEPETHVPGVTYNRPLAIAGRQLMLMQTVEPGFLDEYELAFDSAEYVLLHNQIAEPVPGISVASFAYDADSGKVGLRVGKEELWLTPGDSAVASGHKLRLRSAVFAAGPGAIYIVNDIRFRLLIFAGFALSLIGLLLALLRRTGCPKAVVTLK